MTAPHRRTPEELLRLVQAEEDASKNRGKLKVFLGYASGVGKSFRMVDEGRRRKERGQDVIMGAIQPPIAPDVQAALNNMEVAPVREIDGVPVMDVEAILRRNPRVCLVDGLAYDNPPGSRNPTRWKDVQELLEAGIDVITSINIQYIAELRDRVGALAGKQVSSTVPQSFLFSADEIVVVDVPPEMCMTRTPHGAADETVGAARKLSELREIALLFAADVVDHQLEQYLERNGLTPSVGARERIMVCVTPRTNAKAMIESGRRNASRFHGELVAAYVRQHGLSDEDQAALDKNLAVARENGAEIQILEGDDPIEAILSFARERGITQIFVGHTLQQGWWQRLTGSHVDKLIDRADGIDVRIFPALNDHPEQNGNTSPVRQRLCEKLLLVRTAGSRFLRPFRTLTRAGNPFPADASDDHEAVHILELGQIKHDSFVSPVRNRLRERIPALHGPSPLFRQTLTHWPLFCDNIEAYAGSSRTGQAAHLPRLRRGRR